MLIRAIKATQHAVISANLRLVFKLKSEQSFPPRKVIHCCVTRIPAFIPMFDRHKTNLRYPIMKIYEREIVNTVQITILLAIKYILLQFFLIGHLPL